jgi:predicted metal-dependent hydrolase
MAVPSGTVLQGGRPKAYRPISAADRRAAFLAAVAAYGRGDFFLAHELLEPAWMGTDDTAERELYQGLIKVAAAFVHGVRGNPRGVAKNLQGARDRLAAARDAGVDGGLDLDDLIAAIDARMTRPAPSDAAAPPLLWRTHP